MARRKRTRRKYRLIGFKAYTDADADLLAWWDSITVGGRSDALRELLRMALGYCQIMKPETDLADVHRDIVWMRDALNELPRYVEAVIQHVSAHSAVISANAPPSTNGAPSSGISDAAAQRREQRMKKARW